MCLTRAPSSSELAELVADAEKVEAARILQALLREVGLWLGKPCGEVGQRLPLALRRPPFDVVDEDGTGPAVLEGSSRIRQASGAVLQLGEERKVVAPGQLSNRLLDKVLLGPGLGEGAHVHEVRAREALHRRKHRPEARGHFVNDLGAPSTYPRCWLGSSSARVAKNDEPLTAPPRRISTGPR